MTNFVTDGFPVGDRKGAWGFPIVMAPRVQHLAAVVTMFERDELLRLVRRDHREVEMALIELVAVDLHPEQRRQILDGVRLGIEAHGAAEDIVVYGALDGVATGHVAGLVMLARAAHVELDTILGHVLATPIGAPDWFELVHMLRIRAEAHAAREENDLVPFLREALEPAAYRALAGAFATERLRQLSMLQPSAPVTMPRELVH